MQLEERQRRAEENVFNSVFRNREGYRETRQELEAAGIEPMELDEIQRMEWRNSRRLLRQFGDRALQNINMLRLILNIDGDRDPEDTDEMRVMLFTRIQSVKYNLQEHGHADSCPICCGEFEEKQSVKLLPKCEHIFHEDCIEKWILKAKHRYICCPVCRVNIKEELAAQEEDKAIESQEETKDEEMGKNNESGNSSKSDDVDNMNLLNVTEDNSETLA